MPTLDEIAAALTALAPEHEGMRDWTRLDLLPETMVDVRVSLDQYERRARLLLAVKLPLESLIADGYPDLPARAISEASLQDIQNNLDTLTAARRKFVSNAPTVLHLVAGPVESK